MNTVTMPFWKRAMAVALAGTLAIGLCPTAALAEETGVETQPAAAAEPAPNTEAATEGIETAQTAEPATVAVAAPQADTAPTADPTTPPADNPGASTPGSDNNANGNGGNTDDNNQQQPAQPTTQPKKPVIGFKTAGKIPGQKVAYQKGGATTGKTASTKPLTYIQIRNASKHISGSITYKVRMAGKGWTGWKKQGAKAGNGKTKNAVQALKVKLTGDLGKQYNVFYRAYVVGSGWTGWGKNGEEVGAAKVAAIRAYQVKIAPKKGAAAKAANKKYNTKKARKNRTVANGSEQRTKFAMAAKAQGQTSSTKWLILVDTHKNRVCVLKGKKGQWNVHKYFKCTSGAPGSRTVRGKFTIGSRGLSFGEDKGYSCWYWTQFYGNYLFHSVLYYPGSQRSIQDGRLGINASHGCVRLAIGNAKWINRNIPSGTKVWTY